MSECTATDDGSNGIRAAGGSGIRGDMASGNDQWGLPLDETPACGGNVVNGNGRGTVRRTSIFDPPANVSASSCNGTPTCP